jgi:DNA polymerase-1
MDTFLIIDGNAILYRAYHAIPMLTKSDGSPVNAIYGFLGMLLTLIQEQKPAYIAVAFDRSKPTIRQSMYAGYHQHRPPMENELSSQVPRLEELLVTFGIPLFYSDGYEGDDMIGTLATQAVKEKIDVLVVTGDRDMLQLVNPHVRVLMPILGITKTVIFDEKAVEEKYGVKSEQFVDYKALIGDQSDGYPGVNGIGPKTAATLLQKYKTFENIYEHLPELSERQQLLFAQDAEQAALAKKLATIICDAPITFHKDACEVKNLHISDLREAFKKYEFNTLLRKLEVVFPQVTSVSVGVAQDKSSTQGKEEKKKEENKDQLPLI